MTIDDIRLLYDYHYWANNRLLAVISTLSEEEFCRDVGGAYGSVRNTMVHLLSAEWGWLDRCGGLARGEKLNPRDYSTPDVLVSTCTRVEQHMRDYLAHVSGAELERLVEFSFGGGPSHSRAVSHLLWHASNHAAHHRGQVAMLLRMIGHPAENFDVLFFTPSR
jgi:uncharacterized damage-inducible protein DinB